MSASGPSGPVPAGFDSWDRLYAEQARLNRAANRLYIPEEPGYAGLVVAPENHEVRLYWKGKPSAAADAAVMAARRDAPVRVLPAAYSEKELLAEADRWITSGENVTLAAPKADGSGVSIGVSAPATAGTPRVAGGSSVPITFEYNSNQRQTYDRQNDSPLHYAGGWFGCSLGFAIRDNSTGRDGFLTAGHCIVTGTDIYDGGGDYLGKAKYDVGNKDTGTIEAGSAARMFTGPYNSSTSRPVGWAQKSYAGNWVNSSGAVTGELGGVKILDTTVTIITPTNGTIYNLVRGEHWNKACANTYGNSGGPVFAYPGGANQRVIAYGIVSAAGGRETYCPGLAPNNKGFSQVLYVDVTRLPALPISLKFS
ncbi:hypothetical protein [Kribbella sp. CA-294648]|uniref:hypothetical protein n=1 Tax=Kribbella sp. CA-294648 TaxID=3239948 RepID=UPI003D8CFEFF